MILSKTPLPVINTCLGGRIEKAEVGGKKLKFVILMKRVLILAKTTFAFEKILSRIVVEDTLFRRREDMGHELTFFYHRDA